MPHVCMSGSIARVCPAATTTAVAPTERESTWLAVMPWSGCVERADLEARR